MKYAKTRGLEKLIDKKINLGSFDSFKVKNTGKKQNILMMEAKNGYNNPKPNISPTTEKNYYYRSAWIGEASKIFAKPILKALQERKQNKKEFIKEINESGLNYTYSGFVSAMAGKNPYCVNFTYFIKLYEYLELPFPSLQYLSSFD